MIFVFFSIGYVLCHFGAYLLWLRDRAPLKTERGIFTYHAISYGILVGLTALAGLATASTDTLAGTVFAAGAHGIYSLSFLELWSLTERSYSLGILDQIAQAAGHAACCELTSQQAVGAAKQELRMAAVQRLGLLRADGSLTTAGWLTAIFLRAVLWLSNGESMN